MRFISLLDGQALHSPRMMEQGYVVENPVLKRGANKHGSLSFIMAKTHPLYGKLEDRATWLTVTDGTKEIWRGRVMNQRKTLSQKLEIYCEGELAVLCDSTKRPFVYRGTVRGFLQMAIDNHNAECPMNPYAVGNVTITDPNDYIVRKSPEPMTTWDLIIEKLVKMMGGYIQVRVSNGTRYIDYIAQGATNESQTLEYGKNLLSLDHYIDAANVATALIPYGAQLEEGDPGYEEEPEYGEWNGNRLTIKSVNGGVDWVSNSIGVGKYGLVFDSKTWDDVTTASALKSKAEAELLDRIMQAVTVKVTAVDLSSLDPGLEAIDLLQRVRTYSRPHDLDIWLTCTDIEEPLMNLAKTKFTLGEAGKTMTEIAGRRSSSTTIVSGSGLPTDPTFNSVTVTNGVSAKTVSAAGDVSGGSLSTTGTASAKDVTASNKITTKDIEATGNSFVKGYEIVTGTHSVGGDQVVMGDSSVAGSQVISGSQYVSGNASVYGDEIVSGAISAKNLVGIGRYESWIDLTGSQYNQDTWYPVITDNGIPTHGMYKYEAISILEGHKPSWATHGRGFSCNVAAEYEYSGWGATNGNATSSVLLNQFAWCTKSPVFFAQQMRYASKVIVFLRGGGQYRLYSPNNTTWTVYTSKTNVYSSGSPYYVAPATDIYSGMIPTNNDSYILPVPDNTVKPIVKYGHATINHHANSAGEVTVLYDNKFAGYPEVITSQPFDTVNIIVKKENMYTNGFIAKIPAVGSDGSRDFSWIAIGY